MWIKYQPNPCGRNVSDCAVRAITMALDLDWETAYMMLSDMGLQMCDLMNSDAVWGAVLRQNGFYKTIIPNTCPDCFTARDFCLSNPEGIFVLGFGGHVATVIDGDLYDSWDSSNEIPVYVWYQKER